MNSWCFKFLVFVCLSIGIDRLCLAEELEWQRLACRGYDRDIRCIAVSLNGRDIYIGTSVGLYKLKDDECHRSLQPEGQFRGVNAIYISPFDEGKILAATDSGLYESRDSGIHWKRIYYSTVEDDARCLSVVCLGKNIYLATAGGLFVRDSISDNLWHRVKIRKIYKQSLYHIASNQDYVYVSDRDSLFRIDKDGKIDTVFSVGGGDGDDTDTEDNNETEKECSLIKSVAVKGRYVFIVTSKGIYFSPNDGHKWKSISSMGIPYRQATGVAVDWCRVKFDRRKIYDFRFMLATIDGVFLYDMNRWVPLYKGLDTNKVNCVVFGKGHKSYVGTDSGIFSICLRNSVSFSFKKENKKKNRFKNSSNAKEVLYNNKYEDIRSYFSYEPDINKVQELAIEYAEVSPEKIKAWRRKVRKKAWLPKITVGIDGDKNKTVSDSVWGSYTSGGQSYVGPDDKTFHNNFGWDVSLSWDLSNVIWNEEQTSIDMRSKLMVQLREDILDQVTRLYFERRRIQIELLTNRSMDAKARLDKQLRIEELTAMIDALTGGEFSRRVEFGKKRRMQKLCH